MAAVWPAVSSAQHPGADSFHGLRGASHGPTVVRVAEAQIRPRALKRPTLAPSTGSTSLHVSVTRRTPDWVGGVRHAPQWLYKPFCDAALAWCGKSRSAVTRRRGLRPAPEAVSVSLIGVWEAGDDATRQHCGVQCKHSSYRAKPSQADCCRAALPATCLNQAIASLAEQCSRSNRIKQP